MTVPPDAAAAMNPSPPWSAVRALFEQALALPEAAREPLLADAAHAPQVVAEVRSLLAHAEPDAGGALDLDVPAICGPAAPPPPAPGDAARAGDARDDPPAEAAARPGERFGPWRVVRPLGQGGMGEVWLAQRDDGSFSGEAAVKLLRAGLDSRQVLARFAQERQVLARLNHPNIARLLDAGSTARGRPYFVMEHVNGRPIDQAALALPLEGRLALFLQLADAVAHAHRSLLVHRDLKPSNVLVDADGRVKLLDFGIAKALDPLEAHDGLTTVAGLRPFTPHYASPEQVRGEPVGTGTDVYSLGVLLYQMLTGTRPTGRQATTAIEAARAVLEEEPARPSRLAATDAADPQWAATRRRLGGDLDNIVLKALEKPLERRYASVDALAADLRAHLAGYPVSARPASPAYVLRKFAARNRWAVLAAALGLTGLVTGLAAALVRGHAALALGAAGMTAGLVISLVQARRAALARDQAQARFEDLRQLAHHVLFDYHDLVEPLAGSTPVRRRLVDDAITYLDRLARAAPTDRGVRLEIGMAWRTVGHVQCNGMYRPHLGDRAGAMRSYDQADAWLEPLVAEDPRDDMAAYELALALSARAGVLGDEGNADAATPLFLRAAELFGRHVEPDRPDLRHRLELARTYLRLASVEGLAGLDERGRAHLAMARQHLHEMAALQPRHPELPHVWVWVHGLTRDVCQRAEDWAGVVETNRAAQAIMDRLIAEQPDNARFQEDVAGLAVWHRRAAAAQGDVEATRHWAGRALELWSALSTRDPADPVARRSTLRAIVDGARELAQAGAAHDALQWIDAQAPRLRATVERWPRDADARARSVMLAEARAYALRCAGRRDEAAQALQAAQAQAQAMREAFEGESIVSGAVLAVRFLQAQWGFEDALAAPADAALRTRALAALADVEQQRRDLVQRRMLPNRDFGLRMQKVPQMIERLGAAARA